MPTTVLQTTVVGSYPQPGWLVNRDYLRDHLPPRVRDLGWWRIPLEQLPEALDDATRLAIQDQEAAGIDILSDGEQRRESYSNYFATALDGVSIAPPGQAVDRTGRVVPVPRIIGPVGRSRPIAVRDVEFLRRHTRRPIKITLPGPFTVTQQAQDDRYGDPRRLALDVARALNEEAHDLAAAGADVIQFDEPYMEARPENALAYGIEALGHAVNGIPATTAVHICCGYAHFVHDKAGKPHYAVLSALRDTDVQQISLEAAQPRLDPSLLADLPGKAFIYGVLDLSTVQIESAETVAERIRAALPYVSPDRLLPAPDCGLKYLDREIAYGKLVALVEGARIVRQELALN
jgi:5-methyltetrahydropteroyltriglutamate--homocysteine methyltransferase